MKRAPAGADNDLIIPGIESIWLTLVDFSHPSTIKFGTTEMVHIFIDGVALSLHILWSNRELDLAPKDVIEFDSAPATGWNWCGPL